MKQNVVRKKPLHAGESLKPCPFCGGQAALLGGLGPPFTEKPDQEVFWVQCADQMCGAGGASRFNRERALEVWNRRPETVELEVVPEWAKRRGAP